MGIVNEINLIPAAGSYMLEVKTNQGEVKQIGLVTGPAAADIRDIYEYATRRQTGLLLVPGSGKNADRFSMMAGIRAVSVPLIEGR